MAPHSSILAWKVPWTEKPGRLQSMGSLELDTTERLHFHFSLSCIGVGNGNPLQCSCLENPKDSGAWWAAINGVAQSRTQLKRLSSSSSSSILLNSSTRWVSDWVTGRKFAYKERDGNILGTIPNSTYYSSEVHHDYILKIDLKIWFLVQNKRLLGRLKSIEGMKNSGCLWKVSLGIYKHMP